MMEGWKKELLGDLIYINTESIGRNYPHTEINYYDISSVKSGFVENIDTIFLSDAPSRAKRIVKDKDTILSTVRPRNRSFYYFKEAKENDIVSTGFAVLRPKQNKIDDRYLYYLITDCNFTAFLASNEKGAAYPAVTIDVIERAKIHLPPLPTQRKIAKILSAYDDLIENNLKRIKLLEEMAQKTYEEWFVRMKFPGHETVVFDEESGLPEGWKKVKLFDFADVSYGYPFKAMDFNKNKIGTPIIRIRNIPSSHTEDYTTQKVDEKYFVNIGDLLVGMDGDFHINNWTGDRGYLVQRVCNIKSKNKIHHSFLSQAIKYPIKFFEETISGATVRHLGKMHLEKIYITIPDDKLSYVYSQYNNWLTTKINLSTQNQRLKEARDILLPRLMTGMIDVENI